MAASSNRSTTASKRTGRAASMPKTNKVTSNLQKTVAKTYGIRDPELVAKITSTTFIPSFRNIKTMADARRFITGDRKGPVDFGVLKYIRDRIRDSKNKDSNMTDQEYKNRKDKALEMLDKIAKNDKSDNQYTTFQTFDTTKKIKYVDPNKSRKYDQDTPIVPIKDYIIENPTRIPPDYAKKSLFPIYNPYEQRLISSSPSPVDPLGVTQKDIDFLDEIISRSYSKPKLSRGRRSPQSYDEMKHLLTGFIPSLAPQAELRDDIELTRAPFTGNATVFDQHYNPAFNRNLISEIVVPSRGKPGNRLRSSRIPASQVTLSDEARWLMENEFTPGIPKQKGQRSRKSPKIKVSYQSDSPNRTKVKKLSDADYSKAMKDLLQRRRSLSDEESDGPPTFTIQEPMFGDYDEIPEYARRPDEDIEARWLTENQTEPWQRRGPRGRRKTKAPRAPKQEVLIADDMTPEAIQASRSRRTAKAPTAKSAAAPQPTRRQKKTINRLQANANSIITILSNNPPNDRMTVPQIKKILKDVKRLEPRGDKTFVRLAKNKPGLMKQLQILGNKHLNRTPAPNFPRPVEAIPRHLNEYQMLQRVPSLPPSQKFKAPTVQSQEDLRKAQADYAKKVMEKLGKKPPAAPRKGRKGKKSELNQLEEALLGRLQLPRGGKNPPAMFYPNNGTAFQTDNPAFNQGYVRKGYGEPLIPIRVV